MSLQITYCSICQIYEPCFHVCCKIIFICRACLLDEENLLNYNQCIQCYRPLDMVYNSLIKSVRMNDGNSWANSRVFPNSRPRTPQAGHGHQIMRNCFNFHQTRQEVEEDFEFAQTLQKRKNQQNKFSNDFTSHLRGNSNQYQQENYNQQGINNFFGQNKPFMNQMNQGSATFGRGNNFGNGQFNGNRNEWFDNSNPCNQNSFHQNLGFQHQNEIYQNQNYNQDRGFNNLGNGNGGFNQNIRQSRPFNQKNNFHQSLPQNNFLSNGQYQNQQQLNFGSSNNNNNQTKSNPFSMWNQQKSSKNFQQQNFPQQNPGNLNHSHSQQKNCFQLNSNSFQNINSFERATKSVGKTQQLKRTNTFNGCSSSFKVDNYGNNSNSDKEHSPTFGSELNNDQNFNGSLVPYGGQINRGREKMEIEHEELQQNQNIKKTNSFDSLVTLGQREHSTE